MLAETKDEMREKILDAALKRFMHYGAAKTTMNEIADDLHCSKASLYYYFSDKKALHNAVLVKIGVAFYEEQEAEAENGSSATSILQNIIEIKKQFVERFRRLELFKVLTDKSEDIQKIIAEMAEREYKMLTKIFEKGMTTGEFEKRDAREIAELYHHAMEGLRFTRMDCFTDRIQDIDEEQFGRIIAQQKLLTEIFMRGLRKH